ncbi:MAG: hypothetical protein U0172_05305 [Nitrospiraceae bacterium]
MASKSVERMHAECAVKLLGKDWRLAEIEEPVDFEVHTSGASFGLEVTQVFVDGARNPSSSVKREESLNAKAIKKLADGYYGKGGRRVLARFGGPLQRIVADDLIAAMLNRQPSCENEQVSFSVGAVKVYLTALPEAVGDDRHWLCVSDRVGWVREATQRDLQPAVDRKAGKMESYRKKFQDVVLLLVADRIFNSGRLQVGEGLSVKNPGFKAIYFLSYPEAIIQVG